MVNFRSCRIGWGISTGLALGLGAPVWAADDAPGSVQVSAGTIPFSSQASSEARAAFARRLAEPGINAAKEPIAKVRASYEARDKLTLAKMAALYPVEVRQARMGGVEVQVVNPKSGVPAANRKRVLINVHGGSFLFGWPSGALVESVPIAAVGGFTVVTVNYRMAPEHKFPAGSQDIQAVYRELLKTYPARGIGIYGCSAGAVLTGEAVAWIDHAGLPMPGAIGTFCGSVEGTGGDSQYTGSLLNNFPLPTTVRPMTQSGNGYLDGQSDADPLVIPARSAELLKRFPPSLLITSTRDFAMSNTITAHRDLVKAGVDADLHVWDGLWHAFFNDPDLPESREAYAVISRFFANHLAP
ncbi:alpha/beta hydrolase [Novosphingobium sp. BL-52-GroH]|uniref:alpha/beta hydrolase n=1 Tax=Novosphingobium sp. BL-52-GroH TaxID=3349877 RepID=UPI00384E3BD7